MVVAGERENRRNVRVQAGPGHTAMYPGVVCQPRTMHDPLIEQLSQAGLTLIRPGSCID